MGEPVDPNETPAPGVATLPYAADEGDAPAAADGLAPEDSGTRRALRWRGGGGRERPTEAGTEAHTEAGTEAGTEEGRAAAVAMPAPLASTAEASAGRLAEAAPAWQPPPDFAARTRAFAEHRAQAGARRVADAPSSRRDDTPYPALAGRRGALELTLGWIEQVLSLSVGDSVAVRVVGLGRRWRVRLDEKQLVDLLSSMAQHVREVMPGGGVLTVHTMPTQVRAGEQAKRLGVEPGRYLFLGLAHTRSGAAAITGPKPERARVGLDTAVRVLADAGGALTIDQEPAGHAALKLYLPAAS